MLKTKYSCKVLYKFDLYVLDNEVNYPIKSGVYKIVFGNGSYYIGRSADVYRRLTTHIGAMKKNKHKNNNVQNAYNSYGLPALYLCETKSPEILEKELLLEGKEDSNILNASFPIRTNYKRSNSKGCKWNQSKQKWQAMVIENGVRNIIGYYDTENEASSEYLKYKEKIRKNTMLERTGNGYLINPDI